MSKALMETHYKIWTGVGDEVIRISPDPDSLGLIFITKKFDCLYATVEMLIRPDAARLLAEALLDAASDAPKEIA